VFADFSTSQSINNRLFDITEESFRASQRARERESEEKNRQNPLKVDCKNAK
jgi:hypothetical protein